MANYKLSRYNFAFPFHETASGEKQTVLYNARTGSIAVLEEDNYQQYCAFAEAGTDISDEELLSNLRLGGYVVDEDFDELSALKTKLLSSRYTTNTLFLTIAPTSDCNFRCIYCYEKDSIRPITMSEETQEDLVNFVKMYIPTIRGFRVIWYGGEPLLAIRIIEKLSKIFLELCEENGIEYYASIVTNGYLLTPAIMEKLHAMKVRRMQITLDGAAEDHDKRRFLKGGLPTFDRIIENLCAVKDQMLEDVAIRINADVHNVDRVDNVVKALREKGLLDKVRPYLAMVENRNDAYNDNSCLRASQFSQHEFEFIQRNGLDMVSHTPRQYGNFCTADSWNGFVVNADGRIYKCWNEMGIASCSIGTLKEGVQDCSRLHSFLLFDATEDPVCRECRFLPLCMGGCPYMRIKKLPDRCTAMKHGLDAFMGVIPELIEKQRQAAERESAE